MNKQFKSLFFLLCFSSFLFSHSNMAGELHNKLSLNGLSSHSALNREYYIGALYLPSPARSASMIFNADSLQRMELRISKEKWTPRQFSQLWLQAININNTLADLKPMTQDVIRFSNLINGNLQRGDNIQIDYTPGGGTEVRVNDQLAFKTQTEGFFTALLKTWIGNRPPSSEFKSGILASGQNIDEALVERFKSLKQTKQRKAPLSPSKSDQLKAEKKAAAEKAAKAAAKLKADKKAKADKLAKAKKKAEKAAKAQAAKDKLAQEAKAAQQAKAIAQTAVKITAKAGDKVATGAAAISQTNIATALATTQVKASEEKEATTPEELKPRKNNPAPVVTPKDPAQLQQQGLSNAYQAYVQRRIYQHLVYPNKAYKKGLQGTVIANIKVARDGSINTISLNSNAHSLLQAAARDAVSKAAPFIAIPNTINANTLALSIKLNFKLPPS